MNAAVPTTSTPFGSLRNNVISLGSCSACFSLVSRNLSRSSSCVNPAMDEHLLFWWHLFISSPGCRFRTALDPGMNIDKVKILILTGHRNFPIHINNGQNIEGVVQFLCLGIVVPPNLMSPDALTALNTTSLFCPKSANAAISTITPNRGCFALMLPLCYWMVYRAWKATATIAFLSTQVSAVSSMHSGQRQ